MCSFSVSPDNPRNTSSLYSALGGTSLLKRRPRFFLATASLDPRNLAASICSDSLCCSTLPASPDAFAGPWAFSRMLSSRFSAMINLDLQLKMLPSICRNTPVGRELTEKREEIFPMRRLGVRRVLARDDQFKRCEFSPTVSTGSIASNSLARFVASACDPCLASAIRTLDSNSICASCTSGRLNKLAHGFLRFCISLKLILSGLRSVCPSVPNRTAPCIEEATAEPTKQSSQ
jgi:hypothetical protein